MGEVSRKSRGRCVKSGLVKDGEKEARKKEDLRNRSTRDSRDFRGTRRESLEREKCED